jgi:hypothetical protein
MAHAMARYALPSVLNARWVPPTSLLSISFQICFPCLSVRWFTHSACRRYGPGASPPGPQLTYTIFQPEPQYPTRLSTHGAGNTLHGDRLSGRPGCRQVKPPRACSTHRGATMMPMSIWTRTTAAPWESPSSIVAACVTSPRNRPSSNSMWIARPPSTAAAISSGQRCTTPACIRCRRHWTAAATWVSSRCCSTCRRSSALPRRSRAAI